MKKIIILILSFCLLMTGCSKSRKDGGVSFTKNPSGIGSELSEMDEASSTIMKTYRDSLFLYNDRAIYQSTAVSGIYQIQNGEKSILAEKGNLLGLYKSVLLVDNFQNLMVLNLAGSEEWIDLPILSETFTAIVQKEDDLCIFTPSQQIVVNLSTLQYSQTETAIAPDSVIFDGDTFYYIRSEIKDGIQTAALYTGGMNGTEETYLCSVKPNTRIHKAEEHILIYGQTVNPVLYDLASGLATEVVSFPQPQNSTYLYHDKIAVSWVPSQNRSWCYDIAAGKEVSLAEIDLDQRDSFIADNVCYRSDLEKVGRYFCNVNGISFIMDDISSDISRIAADEQTHAVLTTDGIYLKQQGSVLYFDH